MGKIRATTIGSEDEQKQKEKRERQREAKKALKANEEVKDASLFKAHRSEHAKLDDKRTHDLTKKHVSANSTNHSSPSVVPPEVGRVEGSEKKKKALVKKTSANKTRSTKWLSNIKLREKNKQYKISGALDILLRMKRAKFDESIELHINTTEKGISGNLTLPHGTGKKIKVVIFAPAQDPAAADQLLTDIAAGKIEFDILVATPDAMPRLAKVARILGPRGIMPNPKNGTITPKPEEVAKKFAEGQIQFKTEAKANIIHLSVGKISFGKIKLQENITALLNAVDASKVKSVYIKSTMSPSLQLS